jgi:uncharacterized phage-associated protein
MIIRNPIASDLASPNHVADFLLTDSRRKGDVVTNLKLQKLLYYAQAWYLARFDLPIFQEDFEAWIRGPVLPSQYHRFKSSEWRPIQDDIRAPQSLPPKLAKHLLSIIATFGVETATALEMMTHQEGPWLRARRNVPHNAPSRALITKISMKDYYRHMA